MARPQQRGDVVGAVAEGADLAEHVTQERHVGRADDPQPAADGLTDRDRERGGLDDPEPAVGHDERAADARQTLGMLRLDAHAERQDLPGEVHELRVTAEGVDRIAPVDAPAGEVDRRPERLHAIVVDVGTEEVAHRGAHATSCAGRSGLTVPHS
jgi:hypothetical protein